MEGNRNQEVLAPAKGMTAFPLKMIAIAAMLINHIGCFLIGRSNMPLYIFSLVVGKLTFPIMAYLLVEGYQYTRSKRKYAMRLGAFWLLSIVPFWMLFSNQPFSAVQLVNNVMFTLLMGFLLIWLSDNTNSRVVRVIEVIAFALATVASDWMVVGVLMIYGFHRIKKRNTKVVVPIVVVAMLPLVLLMGISAWGLYQTANPNILGNNNLIMAKYALIEGLGFLGMLLPVPLLLAYNGQRGYSPKWLKWGFYAFYPAHLLVLGLIKHFVM